MKPIPQMEPSFDESERRAMDQYMASGGWLTEHTQTHAFERAVAEYTGANHAVAVANGTLSLALALHALDLPPASQVIVPAFTMVATPNAVKLAGHEPVLVDVSPEHLCLDLDAIKQAVTAATRAVMLVTINGRSPDLTAIAKWCRTEGIQLVEDAAQSLGSLRGGRHLGTFGEVGSFSFSTPKIISTGQGGMTITDDAALATRMRQVKDFGRPRPGSDEHVIMGYNYKFTDMQAVIGIEQMKKLPQRVKRKKAIFRLYKDLLADAPGVRFPPTDLADVAPSFIDAVFEGGRRDAVATALNTQGIGTRPFYPAIHTLPPYSGHKGRFPHAMQAAQDGLWLPSAVTLSDDDVARVAHAIRTALKASRPRVAAKARR